MLPGRSLPVPLRSPTFAPAGVLDRGSFGVGRGRLFGSGTSIMPCIGLILDVALEGGGVGVMLILIGGGG